jgi:BMFP domain-containing protein YqiC
MATSQEYLTQEAAREAQNQQQAAIIARAQAEELRAKVAELEEQLADMKRGSPSP